MPRRPFVPRPQPRTLLSSSRARLVSAPVLIAIGCRNFYAALSVGVQNGNRALVLYLDADLAVPVTMNRHG